MASQFRNQSSSTRRESVNASLLGKSEEKLRSKEKQNKVEKLNSKQNCPESGSDKSDIDIKFDEFRLEVREMFNEFNDSFDKKIVAFEKRLTSSFKEIKKEMNELKSDVSDTKSDVKELKTSVKDIEESVEFQAQLAKDETSRLEDLFKKRNSELEQEVKDMKNRMMWQEKHDRQYNLLFYGMTEKAGEDLEKVMKTFFKDKLQIDNDRVDDMKFANYHRLPGDAPKPVIIKFLSMNDRNLVFAQSFLPVLRAERKRILTDLPVPMKKERGRLAKIAYEIRQSEKLQTRIIEKGLSVFLEVRKDKESEWAFREA